MRRSSGFTLLEIMISVAIAGIIGLVVFRLLDNTQQLSAMLQARNDAERQTLLLLQRLNTQYLQKKPGDIIAAKNATEEKFLRDYSCDKSLTPQQRMTTYKPFSFTLHHDTEGCMPGSIFPSLLVGCRGISVATGVWTVANDNGCSDEKNYAIFTAISKCQKINAKGNSPLNELDFRKPNLAGKKMTECTSCSKGERPIVVINHYAIPTDPSDKHGPRRASAINEWKVLPDGNLSLVGGADGKIENIGGSLKASERKEFKKQSFLTSSAIGLELCTHLDGGSVLIDINGFYVQRVSGADGRETFDLRKVKQQTSYPKEVISNQDFRYMP